MFGRPLVFIRWCALCGLAGVWVLAWWLAGVLIELLRR